MHADRTRDLAHHISAAAHAAGVPAPAPEELQAFAQHPLVRRFEDLLARPGAAHASGGKGAPPSPSVEGDNLLRTTLATVLGFIDRAEAAGQGPLSPLATETRDLLQGLLRKHARTQ